MLRNVCTSALVLALACATRGAILTENFDESGGFFGTTGLGGVPSAPVVPGWVVINNSNPNGPSSWYSGSSSSPFAPQSGSGFAAVDKNSTLSTNDISNWLLTPTISFAAGDTISFYTRTVAPVEFPDRLQVRLSTNGSSTDVGASAVSFGDFGTLLTDINPNLTTVGYPTAWTQYNLTIPATGTGRIAFRYFVSSGGPAGTNSNFIGVDTINIVPEPLGLGTIAAAAMALARRRPQR